MKIEIAQLNELVTDDKNARKHSDTNLKAIASSLNRFGQRKPIAIRGKKVLAGNGTLEAARSLGWTEIAVVQVPDNWDEDTAKAYALADNQTAALAEWDERTLAQQLSELDEAGWDVETLGFAKKEAMPNFEPEETPQVRLDQRASTMCPQCSFEWRVGAQGEIQPV